jgi:hypothetical protein
MVQLKSGRTAPVPGHTIRAKLCKTSCKTVAKMQRSKQDCYCLADCLAMRAQAHTAFERAKVTLAQAEARYLAACHHEQLKDLESLCE